MLWNTFDGEWIPNQLFTALTIGSTKLDFSQEPMPFMPSTMPFFRPEIRLLPALDSHEPALVNAPVTGLTTWLPIQPPIRDAPSDTPDFSPDTIADPRPYSHDPADVKGRTAGLMT